MAEIKRKQPPFPSAAGPAASGISLGRRIGWLILFSLVVLTACGPNSEEDYFSLATQFYDSGRFEDAIKVLKKYLEIYPQGGRRDRALYELGRIEYYALGRRGEAVRTFRRLMIQHPAGDFSFEARKILAGAFEETQDWDAAIREYQTLIRDRPQHPDRMEFRFRLALARFSKDDPERGIEELGRLLAESRGSSFGPQAFIELGGAHFRLGRHEEALYVFEAFIDRFPDHSLASTARFLKAATLEEMGRNPEALAEYEALLPVYHNPGAVETRVHGLKDRMKKAGAPARPVDYKYRPETTPETTRNLTEKEKKTGK
jgi:tetratricopeptide (TPR) repeat protein